MDGPPPKRPRRDGYDASRSRIDRDTLSPAPRSPQPVNGHGKHDDERTNTRRPSRSPRDSKYGRRDRSRSREAKRDKDRSYRDRSRDRIRDRDRDRDRDRGGRNGRPQERGADKGRRYSQSRSRSRSPRRKTDASTATHSTPRQSGVSRAETNGTAVKREDRDMDLDGDDGGSEAEMRRLMGFATFKSTKNTKVPGNQIYGVRKEKKAKYRQYMNRVGGFNRPLSPSR